VLLLIILGLLSLAGIGEADFQQACRVGPVNLPVLPEKRQDADAFDLQILYYRFFECRGDYQWIASNQGGTKNEQWQRDA
jgi:hypothetical protein